MRIIFDTNILISYLLSPSNAGRTIVQLVEAAIGGAFTLILPMDLINELEQTIAESNHLSRAITPEEVEIFLRALESRSEVLAVVPVPQPMVTRDPEDDYLLAAAAIADADVLVTGDRDLLDIRELLPRPVIMTPGEFLDLIILMEPPQP